MLFEDILEEAYIQQGFDTEGYQLFIEAKPMPNHGFYISITKFYDEDELDEDHSFGYFISDAENFLITSRDSRVNNELVFSFASIEDICPCIICLENYSIEKSSLFSLNGSYILTLKISEHDHSHSSLAACLSEHGTQEYFSHAYVDEHGKRILVKNALEGLKKYFNIY